MKNIIITGSTRGIGFGLAREFLERGCNVVVSGRTQAGVDQALAQLNSYRAESIVGQPCDMTDLEQVEALWAAGIEKFGRIDIWINNAGRGHPQQPIWEIPVDTVHAVFDLDVNGLIYGCRVAIANMLKQGGGFVYNMEGFGSDGRTRAGMGVYGASKAAVTYLTKTLIVETKETPVKVGYLSPGIVATDFLSDMYTDDPAAFEKSKRIFNILADKPETVTPYLAEQLLANEKHGKRIAWLTTPKIMKRFLTAPFNKRDVFA